MLGRIRAHEPPPKPRDASASGSSSASVAWHGMKDLRTGMRAVFQHPQVRPLVLSSLLASISGGFFVALYALFCLRELGLSEATFGVIVAMGGVGSLGGALVSRRLVRSVGLGWTLIATSTLSVAASLLIPLASGSRTSILVLLGAHQLLGDGFAVAYVVQAVTLRQTVLPQQVLGRANAAIFVCSVAPLPIVAILAGTLAQVTTTRFAVWVGVIIGLLTPLTLWPLRKLRAMPSPAT
jgi:Na+/melibiose symporter-like transporter